MSEWYYLDENNEAIRARSLEEWAEKSKRHRHVADETINGVRISTVFLGLNHSWGNEPPLLFETMIFGGPLDSRQDRYSTYEEAEQGHKEAVKRVKLLQMSTDNTTPHQRAAGREEASTFVDTVANEPLSKPLVEDGGGATPQGSPIQAWAITWKIRKTLPEGKLTGWIKKRSVHYVEANAFARAEQLKRSAKLVKDIRIVELIEKPERVITEEMLAKKLETYDWFIESRRGKEGTGMTFLCGEASQLRDCIAYLRGEVEEI